MFLSDYPLFIPNPASYYIPHRKQPLLAIGSKGEKFCQLFFSGDLRKRQQLTNAHSRVQLENLWLP